ncbi:DUF6473 family protein [Thetidibacter halocola]|uniref:DUF6473 domain-containing protein n=1 Tax=Thetidibacter halocola TaxID=2827239 RepID=A0A8J7WGP8_9RHOB|nr:DUF6473 family protein [Thetidibacter halocola]MBS0124783.1 hypothetical protein [Thetidibacter halocola]
MAFQRRAGDGLNYQHCRYGSSRVLFRGPSPDLTQDYITFLGGTETYGRFIPTPFPALLQGRVAPGCVNFGLTNAGLDLFLNDADVLGIAAQARVRILQILGAQNMSNRFYQVHPRRNDRFLRASDRLCQLYPEVDFTEFHFIRHMLGHLAQLSQERYGQVVAELRTAWVARMRHILMVLEAPVVLLWFADHAPPDHEVPDLRHDPLFITRAMLDAVRPHAADLVEVPCSDQALCDGTQGMVFAENEAEAAALLLGPRAHHEAAEALLPVLRPHLRRDAA